METKKYSFCPTCGAALLGEETFCGSCGAKLPAAVHAAPAPEAAAAPAAEPVAGTAPVTPPANALTPKAKLSVFGLIAAVLALGAALLANVLFVVNLVMMYGDIFSEFGMNVLMNSCTGMVVAMIVPLAALLAVFVKNKPLAVAGLIFAVLSLTMQFLFSIVHFFVVQRGLYHPALGFLLRPVNGEALLVDIWQLFHAAGRSGRVLVRLLISLSASLLYFGKNILTAVACLAVVVKRKK